MTQSDLFTVLLVTVAMGTGGAVQFSRKNYALGSFMIAIPIIALAARMFGS